MINILHKRPEGVALHLRKNGAENLTREFTDSAIENGLFNRKNHNGTLVPGYTLSKGSYRNCYD